MPRRILLGLLILIAIITSIQLLNSGTAYAVNNTAFNPGRIIDDAIFYDPGGMGSVAEVQNFLDAHVPSCDTNGTRASGYGNLTNAQYAQQIKNWPGPPYVCLDNYYENPSNGETSYERGGGAFSGGISSAQIIYDAAQQYRINPKVLLVMLRKESLNLFSDSWPMKSQYKYAMGYACPDSGPNYSASCDISKAGFYKQINLAAWQLRYYYDHMGSYNYAPGRMNTIQYAVDPNCGTKSVYIENYATASLYIYTPYTPNDAALNSYPSAVPCGAYGNRNFWFMWQEWFGSSIVDGNFLRSPNDATVYLVGDKIKYPVSDSGLIGAASGLGGVGFVSQTYLDNIPTGPLLGRTIQSPDGTVYFYDSNIKLPFTSCAMVAAYGSICGGSAKLTQSQIDKFSSGPQVSNGMRTVSGKSYYITAGQKREVLDDQSLTAAGLTPGYNVLSDSAFNYLPNGVPYIRDNILIKNRQDTTKQLVRVAGQVYRVNTTEYTYQTFSSLPSAMLDSQNMALLTVAPTAIDDSFKDETNKVYVMTQDGKKFVPDTASFGIPSLQLPASFINLLNGSGSLSNPSLLKTANSGTVYVIVGGEKRPLVAMEDLKSITGEDSPYIGWTSGGLLDGMTSGNIIVGAGRLVKTASNGTVYMTDGYNKLIPMSSFAPATDMGLNTTIRTISDSILSKYTVDTTILQSYVSCSGVNYVSMGGTLYKHTISGSTARGLQAVTCNVLLKSDTLPRFLRTPDGTIYDFKVGVMHPINSWATYVNLSAGGGATVSITLSTSLLLPKGAAL
jgi:hypothetical protein